MSLHTEQPLTPTGEDPHTWGLRNAHDPTIVQTPEGTFVMFCTDANANGPAPAGVHMRVSTDLIDWQWAGTALGQVPPVAEQWTGAQGLWAPEVIAWPTQSGEPLWHMYYSASTFGSRTSAIGLATAPHPLGPWTAGPLVVKTHHDYSPHNAIDAAVQWDHNGVPWLYYGSFFGGLCALELDANTGLPVHEGELGHRFAGRPRSVEGALEGPFVVRHDSTYTCFVSFDSLVNTYDVRVAQSASPTGPFVDRDGAALISSTPDGQPLTDAPDAHGTIALAGYRLPGQRTLIAPGHNSVLLSDDGDFLVHHVRYALSPREHSAQVRRLFWLDSGWPVVSPAPYLGESASFSQNLACSSEVAGTWDVVDFRDAKEFAVVNEELRAPFTPSVERTCVADLAEFGVVEGAVFTVRVEGPSGVENRTAFSGYARSSGGTPRLTAIFGIKH